VDGGGERRKRRRKRREKRWRKRRRRRSTTEDFTNPSSRVNSTVAASSLFNSAFVKRFGTVLGILTAF